MRRRALSLALLYLGFSGHLHVSAGPPEAPVRLYDPPAVAWPERQWPRARPEDCGMSSRGLREAARFAQKYAGVSGCVIRGGFLVNLWGSPEKRADIKSATKGSIGATLLGLALARGLVELDRQARHYYPALGGERPENRRTKWLRLITVRHLATMTAGFDNGRPPHLVYRPGSRGIYSNDTSNMLAELLTLRFKKDLKEILARFVMEQVGIEKARWNWRENAYRPKRISGIASREFASGITITCQALARIGYLYLREGRWKDREILPARFVREATRPSRLPTPFPGYGFYWVSNAGGTFGRIPRDTAWALGLGDSFVLICPSLDLVVVRLGRGSRASQLPGKPGWGGERVARFFELILKAVREPPVAVSSEIRGVVWDRPESVLRKAHGSDNWPVTWADDGDLYTAYGDGFGFKPHLKEKLSLGFAKVRGRPPQITGINIRSPTGERKGAGRSGAKASGLLMVKGTLYMLARNTGNAQLAWSADHARTWTWARWRFTESFGCPTFVNFSRNYGGARDGYVYIVSPDSDNAYCYADTMILARVPKDRIAQREAYRFFAGFTRPGVPSWSPDITKRTPIFTSPGRCRRSGITYNAGLRRYLWVHTFGEEDCRFRGGLAIYEAPEPWGPWRAVYWTRTWDVGPGESACFPSKWISRSGKELHLLFSGNDAFSVREVRLKLWEEEGL